MNLEAGLLDAIEQNCWHDDPPEGTSKHAITETLHALRLRFLKAKDFWRKGRVEFLLGDVEERKTWMRRAVNSLAKAGSDPEKRIDYGMALSEYGLFLVDETMARKGVEVTAEVVRSRGRSTDHQALGFAYDLLAGTMTEPDAALRSAINSYRIAESMCPDAHNAEKIKGLEAEL